MSFDIFYQPCHFGTELVERRNPFTGEVQSAPAVEPLSEDEVRAVRGVLAAAGVGQADEFNFRGVALADGGEAEVIGDDPSDGLTVTLRGLTPNLLRFLFDLLQAANWAMLAAMEGNPAIVAVAGRDGGPYADFPEGVCRSPEHLGAILSGGFEAWDAYKDQVSGPGDPPGSPAPAPQ